MKSMKMNEWMNEKTLAASARANNDQESKRNKTNMRIGNFLHSKHLIN